MLGFSGHVEATLKPCGQGFNIPQAELAQVRLGFSGHVGAMLKPCGQGCNIPQIELPI